MANITSALTYESALKGLYGIGDLEVEEGMHPGVPTAWEVGETTSDSGSGEWLHIGPNGAVLPASETDDAIYVRYELWDSPPPLDASWERSWTGETQFTSGKITALSMPYDEIQHHEVFDLGRSDTTWALRVSRKLLQNDRESDFSAQCGSARRHVGGVR